MILRHPISTLFPYTTLFRSEYSAAERLVPDNAEMIYWHAVALVNMGRVDESLPLFRKVFAMDKNWATLTPRLPKSGLLPNDPKDRKSTRLNSSHSQISYAVF